jgi:hypothetical protein
MGWIHNRHMRSGGSLNPNPRNNGSQKGPLRKVVRFLYRQEGFFGKDRYELECGHKVLGTIGAARVRCWKCKQGKPRDGPDDPLGFLK